MKEKYPIGSFLEIYFTAPSVDKWNLSSQLIALVLNQGFTRESLLSTV